MKALGIIAFLALAAIIAFAQRFELTQPIQNGSSTQVWRIDRWTGAVSICIYYSTSFSDECRPVGVDPWARFKLVKAAPKGDEVAPKGKWGNDPIVKPAPTASPPAGAKDDPWARFRNPPAWFGSPGGPAAQPPPAE